MIEDEGVGGVVHFVHLSNGVAPRVLGGCRGTLVVSVVALCYNRSHIHLALGEGITDIKIAAILQLKVSHIARFRAVLSRKYSCPHLHAYRHVGLI
jgi:hypothetical protein